MLTVAVRALRATTVRSLALAATGAIAVFGCVVAEDSHNDLLHGLYRDYSQYVSTADLWVAGADDDLATNSFHAGRLPARIAAIPGVGARAHLPGRLPELRRQARVDHRSRRPHSVADPRQSAAAGASPLRLRACEQAVGSRVPAARRSSTSACRRRLTLPTPTGPRAYRIAATTTNLGWSAGAIIINDSDYNRAWATADPSALEVSARPGADIPALQAAIVAVLGPGQCAGGPDERRTGRAGRRAGAPRAQPHEPDHAAADDRGGAGDGGRDRSRRLAAALVAGVIAHSQLHARGSSAACSPSSRCSCSARAGSRGRPPGIYGHLLCDRFQAHDRVPGTVRGGRPSHHPDDPVDRRRRASRARRPRVRRLAGAAAACAPGVEHWVGRTRVPLFRTSMVA